MGALEHNLYGPVSILIFQYGENPGFASNPIPMEINTKTPIDLGEGSISVK